MSRVRLTIEPPDLSPSFTVEGALVEWHEGLGRYTLKFDDGDIYRIFAEYVGKVEEVTDEAE